MTNMVNYSFRGTVMSEVKGLVSGITAIVSYPTEIGSALAIAPLLLLVFFCRRESVKEDSHTGLPCCLFSIMLLW